MALAIQTGAEPSPYQQTGRMRQNELLGLATTGSSQLQESRFRAYAKVLSRHSNFALVSSASTISEHGLLGSSRPSEPARFRFPAAALVLEGPFVKAQPIPGSAFFHQHDTPHAWIADALEELEQVDEEAAEEGLPLSNQKTKQFARKILNKLAYKSAPGPTVYPTENGAIAILFQDRRSQSAVLILCEQDGSGACFSTIAGKNRRARYDDASDLPDAFVISQLELLPVE